MVEAIVIFFLVLGVGFVLGILCVASSDNHKEHIKLKEEKAKLERTIEIQTIVNESLVGVKDGLSGLVRQEYQSLKSEMNDGLNSLETGISQAFERIRSLDEIFTDYLRKKTRRKK